MSGDNWQLTNYRLNIAGFRALRTCPAAKEWASGVARKIAAAASAASGEAYDARESPGRNRARAVVSPATPAAARDSLQNLTLLRSMGAGRS